MTLPFFSPQWAEAAKQAVNAGPSPEVKEQKLEKYWDWIDDAKAKLDCRLGLAVYGLPEGRPDCLLLELAAGEVKSARLLPLAEAEARATYILAGDYEAWREIMGGFDIGKTIMYRKLLLERGEVLEFFKSAYFWTESLACIQRIPTEL